ncbi:MAG: family ATPase [Planctomycetota bacterium]|jgi:MoxR-like ATPase
MTALPDTATVADAARLAAALIDGCDRVLLGQPLLTRTVATALVAGGHVLLEGLPGLGKTELVKALATLTGCEHRRIQFTPDLLPSDITGTQMLEGGSLQFRAGPVFTQIVLADEINRASPKTQAALLEAMAERSVTVLGRTHALPDPFFVLATQNPVELDGTYPLPEAQLDRFLMKVQVLGVGPEILARLVVERPDGRPPAPQPVMDPSGLRRLVAAARTVAVPEAVARWIAALVTATRPDLPDAPACTKALVRWGCGPRAALALAAAARAAALIDGRPAAGFADVRTMAPMVLAHRLIPAYEAGLQGRDARSVVDELLGLVPELPR